MDASFGPDGYRRQARDGGAGRGGHAGGAGRDGLRPNLPPLLQGAGGPSGVGAAGRLTAPHTGTPAYGYGLAFGRSVWLGLQGPGLSPLLTANAGMHPWNWLNQLQQPLWGTVNQAFTDALAGPRRSDPFQLYATQVFQSAVGRVGAPCRATGGRSWARSSISWPASSTA